MPQQIPSDNKTNLTPKGGITVGVLLIVIGIVVILLGTGVIHTRPETKHAPGWVIASAGLIFILCGAAVINGYAIARGLDSNGNFSSATNPIVQRVQDFLGLSVIGVFMVISGWVSFGPGERQFTTGSNSQLNPGTPISSGSGRVAFGIGFVILLLIFIIFLKKITQRVRGKN